MKVIRSNPAAMMGVEHMTEEVDNIEDLTWVKYWMHLYDCDYIFRDGHEIRAKMNNGTEYVIGLVLAGDE